ncbi:hypothetical protein AXF42_Ash013833 [Apostasia shenzhenica]|uniref:Transcription repressor n=1 Tax=Apostasia shenzhenica TaxID=1088818 RepID=A0A2I0AS03_9ASPA|nr:hypothetical protein AXF42_Ash013833 [Apostasia shenzhenica]
MSYGGRRKFFMKHPALVVDVGCGCRRPKLSSLLSSLRQKPRRASTTPHSLSSSSTATTSLWASTATTAATTNSSYYSSSPSPQQRRSTRKAKKQSSASTESVAVVKETSEPYSEFRDSMVQMIVENELYAWDELNDLLHRFLSLNSPRHHHLILRAFTDLWTSAAFSPPSARREKIVVSVPVEHRIDSNFVPRSNLIQNEVNPSYN